MHYKEQLTVPMITDVLQNDFHSIYDKVGITHNCFGIYD